MPKEETDKTNLYCNIPTYIKCLLCQCILTVTGSSSVCAVSYTHLDVYKRQVYLCVHFGGYKYYAFSVFLVGTLDIGFVCSFVFYKRKLIHGIM